ncbi:MAG TPA: hypothetical protein VMW74_02065 [Nitrosopumilaceae archaeon]|nr:hypothetical protein [Nitrosopumilaceae archaeon]
MSSEIYEITTPDAILRIKKLISQNQGDKGRLQYIMETLQKGKKLFHSDQIYLDKNISAIVIPTQPSEPSATEEKLKNVKKLISLNFGDLERLRYMFQRLQKNKDLYNSDEKYLESKTEQITSLRQRKKFNHLMGSAITSSPNPKINDEIFSNLGSEKFEKEQLGGFLSKDMSILPTRDTIHESSTLSRDKSKIVYRDDEYIHYNLEIENERQNISKLKLEDDQIKIQRDELSQLIAYRQEYEIKINRESEILEKETEFAQEEIKNKDILVEALITNQSKTIQIKTEREVLVEQFKIYKATGQEELEKKQKELEELKIVFVQDISNQEYATMQSDAPILDGDSHPIKKIYLKKTIRRRLGISIVALGLILGVSAIIINPAEFWICNLLEILNISLLSFC